MGGSGGRLVGGLDLLLRAETVHGECWFAGWGLRLGRGVSSGGGGNGRCEGCSHPLNYYFLNRAYRSSQRIVDVSTGNAAVSRPRTRSSERRAAMCPRRHVDSRVMVPSECVESCKCGMWESSKQPYVKSTLSYISSRALVDLRLHAGANEWKSSFEGVSVCRYPNSRSVRSRTNGAVGSLWRWRGSESAVRAAAMCSDVEWSEMSDWAKQCLSYMSNSGQSQR